MSKYAREYENVCLQLLDRHSRQLQIESVRFTLFNADERNWQCSPARLHGRLLDRLFLPHIWLSSVDWKDWSEGRKWMWVHVCGIARCTYVYKILQPSHAFKHFVLFAALDLPSSVPYKCRTNSSQLCSPILILLYCMTLYLAKVRHHNIMSQICYTCLREATLVIHFDLGSTQCCTNNQIDYWKKFNNNSTVSVISISKSDILKKGRLWSAFESFFICEISHEIIHQILWFRIAILITSH